MKFFRFAITVLAAATSSSCFVSATAAAAAAFRKRKITKKRGSPLGFVLTGGSLYEYDEDLAATGATHKCDSSDHCSGSGGATETGSTDGSVVSIGESCVKTNANPNPICTIPAGLDHGVCECNRCQSGQPGAYCDQTSDCVIPPGLDHPVCIDDRPGYTTKHCDRCQSGQPGSFCGQTSDCVVQTDLDPPHAVCRGPLPRKCQR